MIADTLPLIAYCDNGHRHEWSADGREYTVRNHEGRELMTIRLERDGRQEVRGCVLCGQWLRRQQ